MVGSFLDVCTPVAAHHEDSGQFPKLRLVTTGSTIFTAGAFEVHTFHGMLYVAI